MPKQRHVVSLLPSIAEDQNICISIYLPHSPQAGSIVHQDKITGQSPAPYRSCPLSPSFTSSFPSLYSCAFKPVSGTSWCRKTTPRTWPGTHNHTNWCFCAAVWIRFRNLVALQASARVYLHSNIIYLIYLTLLHSDWDQIRRRITTLGVIYSSLFLCDYAVCSAISGLCLFFTITHEAR